MQPLVHIMTITIQTAGGLLPPERRSEGKVRAQVARLLRGLSVVLSRSDVAKGEKRDKARRSAVSRLNSHIPSYRSKDEPLNRCQSRDIRVQSCRSDPWVEPTTRHSDTCSRLCAVCSQTSDRLFSGQVGWAPFVP
jgi:hypothetical protein